MLSHRHAVEYLLRHGYLDARTVVDGCLSVSAASRRNCNYQVLVEGGPSYFLKQGTEEAGRETVAHEAAVYRALRDSAPALVPYLPRYYRYDSGERLLVLELLVDAEDLRAFHRRHRRIPAAIAAGVGEALAQLHRAGLGRPDPRHSEPPWILSLHDPPLAVLREMGEATLSLVKLVQRTPELCAHLDTLRAEWQASCAIHGDLKWDNCLVLHDRHRGARIRIVDWELATAGDPCWDIGSLFMDYLSEWILSMQRVPTATVAAVLDSARSPLRAMRPAIAALWRAYHAALGADAASAADRLTRATRFSAARLLQSVYEYAQWTPQVDLHASLAVQLCVNILRRPREAAIHLLGVRA